jgi:7-carboxy-7-deazaguanine synthase
MFGQNPLRKQELGDGKTLWVQEVFKTIQGEGPLSGLPAVFVRLAGCNLACHFCDTQFEDSTWHPTLEELVSDVEGKLDRSNLVVLTGGEPLRQNILPLIVELNDSCIQVQIETAGTLWIPGLEDLFPTEGAIVDNSIVCSPKTPKLNTGTVKLVNAFKYIIEANEPGSLLLKTCPDDGLPMSSTQAANRVSRIARPWDYETDLDAEVYVQPCDAHDEAKTKANIARAVEVSMKYGYRLSLQIQKSIGLP